jgi:transcriptional regulator with XRE-family HTH domain
MSAELSIEAGRVLNAARTLAKLSAAKLIAASGDKTLTRPLVSQYERGAVLIGYERLVRLLAACGSLPPGDLRAKYAALANDRPEFAQSVERTPAEVATQAAWGEFVLVWQSSGSCAEVAARLGVSRQAVSMRAATARRHGVPLKKMSRIAFLDWGALREIAESTQPAKSAG